MSGAVPPAAARPLERAVRVPRPVCPWCGRCGRVDPAPAPQRAPLRAGVARCGGGGRASPGGVPSTVVRGAWCQALSLPRPPVLWSGQPGFRDPCVPGAVDGGVWTLHRPHSVRPCGPALLAVGVAGGRPRGGVPSSVVRGAWCQALSLPRLPVLWSGQPGFRCACVFVCVLCLAGSGGPASRARSGAPHLFLWPLCLSALLGSLRAGVAPLSLAALAVPRCLGAVLWFFFSASRCLALPPLAPRFCLLLGRWLLFGGFSPHLLSFCVSLFSSLLLGALVFFFFFFLPLCAPVVSGFLLFPAPGALDLGAVRSLLCWPSASRLSVRLSPFRAFRLAGGCSPSVAAHPPPLFGSRFSSLPLGAVCRVLCCAVRPWVRCCAALLCVVFSGVVLFCAVLCSLGAAACCAVPSGAARCPGALCSAALRFAVFPRAVCVLSWRGGACCCSPLCFVLCVSRGAVLCVPCPLRSVRCCASLCWCARVVLFVWCVLLLAPGAVVCRGAVLGLLARGCLLVACFGVGVPVWPRGLFPCGWCVLLWCPAFLCRVLWCCAVAWCRAVVLCCRVAVLLGLALPSCGLSCCAVLCCWLAVLFFARWWWLRAVVLFSSCCAFPVFSALCAAVPCCAGCGALLPCVVCCGSVLSCGAVLSCSAVVLRCCLCLLCPPAARRAAPVSSALLLVPRAVACPCALWCLPGRSAVCWCCSGVSWCLAVLCVVLWCPAPCAVSCGAVPPCWVCFLRGCGCTYLKNRC